MYAPREANQEEYELLVSKVVGLWSMSPSELSVEEELEYLACIVDEACVAVFDSFCFSEGDDDVYKLVMVFWPDRPECYEAFAITRDDELKTIYQDESVREEPETAQHT